MSPICCCFGKRTTGRRSGKTQGRHDGEKGTQDSNDLQSPLSCNSYTSEYYDAQETFPGADGPSQPCSINATPRVSISCDKHKDQAAAAATSDTTDVSDAGVRQLCGDDGAACGAAAAVAAVSVPVDGDRFEDGRLVGSSEASEEPLQGGGSAISKLASCLSILDAIRMPGGSSSPTAAGAVQGPFGSASSQPHHAVSGSAANAGGGGGGGGSVRPSSRRLGGKLEPGCTLRRRDMSSSVLDVREAWDECDDGAAAAATTRSSSGGGAAAPSGSGRRPFMVRGVDYMRSRLKVPGCGPLYRLLAADVVSSDNRLTHVARLANIGGMLRPAVDPHLPPLLIITIMLPMYPATLFGGNDGPNQSLIYYFALPPDFNPAAYGNQAALALLRRFTTNGREADGSPTRDRFKLIPRVVNVDEWAARGPLSPAEHKLLATYNDKPILTRPQQYFFNGPGYLEVDIDIHSYQFLARKAFGAYFGRLKEVIFENAFVIQGNSPEELPEQILGSVRMYRIDLLRSRPLRDFITPAAAGHAGPQSAESGSVGGRRPPASQGPPLSPAIPEAGEELAS